MEEPDAILGSDPDVEGTLIPAPGTFAVMTVDAPASVAFLDDAEATAAATSSFTGKDYIVFSPGTMELFNPTAAFRNVDVLFVIQDPPQTIPSHFIDAAMSLPIAPQTKPEHPSGREPLEVSRNAFPWADCHLSPFSGTTVRYTTAGNPGDRIYCGLESKERLRFRLFKLEDTKKQRTLKREHAAAHPTPARTPTTPEPVVAAADGKDVPVPDRESDEGFGDTEQAQMDLFCSLLQPEAPEDQTTVRFTYDLTRVKDFNDPRGFFAELEQIAQIVRDSAARKTAAKTATAEADAARYDRKMARMLHGHRVSRILSRVVVVGKRTLRRLLCLSPPQQDT